MMYRCFETKLALALFLRHFECFRTAKVSTEPAPSKRFEMPKVSDAVESWCSFFGYFPFDFCYAVGPKPRYGFPDESEENKKNVTLGLLRTAKFYALLSLLGFPVGVSGDDVPFEIVREPFDRQKRHFQHGVVPGIARYL